MPGTQLADGLAAVVTAEAAHRPDGGWVESARDDRVVTRAELAVVAARWAQCDLAGRRLGLAVDDPVAFAVLFVALIAAGVTVVPLDASAPEPASRALLETAGADEVVVTAADRAPVGRDRLLVVDAATLLPPDGLPAAAAPVGSADGGCLLFSSGSTGPRKAIRLPAAQLLHVARAVARGHELGESDRGFNPLPLFHVNGEVVGLLAPLVSGGSVVLDRRFHRSGFWELVAQRRVTWVNAVPGIIAILAQEAPGPSAPPSVRFVRSASAALPRAVMERFEQRHGVPVIESYGMTEAASQITANPLHDRRPGSVGVPVDVDLRVVGEHGRDAGPGEVGRVCIRGRGVVTGYEGGAGTDRFDADGWLDTGDLGSLDADGRLSLAGRDGDVINRSGEKIFPREVEDVLRADPAVREAVVIGRADPVLGEVPVAYVVAVEDAPPDLPDRLQQRCAESLPRAHRPAEVVTVPELPLGPTGKTSRRLVVAQDQQRSAAAGRSRR